jgi:hypothetical protein
VASEVSCQKMYGIEVIATTAHNKQDTVSGPNKAVPYSHDIYESRSDLSALTTYLSSYHIYVEGSSQELLYRTYQPYQHLYKGNPPVPDICMLHYILLLQPASQWFIARLYLA